MHDFTHTLYHNNQQLQLGPLKCTGVYSKLMDSRVVTFSFILVVTVISVLDFIKQGPEYDHS